MVNRKTVIIGWRSYSNYRMKCKGNGDIHLYEHGTKKKTDTLQSIQELHARLSILLLGALPLSFREVFGLHNCILVSSVTC